jgi:hypothetical protein
MNFFLNRCGEVASNLNKMEKAVKGIFLDIHSSNEYTIHPANGVLIDALQSFSSNTCTAQSILATGDCTSEHYTHMFDWWASKLEKDAKMVCPGEKGRKYMFLLNNTCRVLQMMRRPGATFPIGELMSRLSSLIQRYKQSYMAECWVPLKNTHHSNSDEFTAKFFSTCDKQRTWKGSTPPCGVARGWPAPPYGAAALWPPSVSPLDSVFVSGK